MSYRFQSVTSHKAVSFNFVLFTIEKLNLDFLNELNKFFFTVTKSEHRTGDTSIKTVNEAFL